MAKCVCPWWLGYLLASPIRRWMKSPAKILAPYVREGMTVLEPGPGMGFFTLDLARLVGGSGRVVAVDIQSKMLDGLKRRAAKAGLLDRLDLRLAPAESLSLNGLAGAVDFTLASAVVHEVPDAGRFFAEVAEASKPGARLLLIEPKAHVNAQEFEEELQLAGRAGFGPLDRLSVGRGRGALLKKG